MQDKTKRFSSTGRDLQSIGRAEVEESIRRFRRYATAHPETKLEMASATATGRNLKDFAIQRMPTPGELREKIGRPKEGQVFVTCDYDGYEMRIMAQLNHNADE